MEAGQPLNAQTAGVPCQNCPGCNSCKGKPASKPALKDPAAIVCDLFRAESMDVSIEEGCHLFNQYIAPSAVINGAFLGQRDMSLQDFKSCYREMKHAFPDMNMVVYDVTSGTGTNGAPIVWARWSKLGRFEHPLYGLPPTGNRVAMTGVLVCRFTKPGEACAAMGHPTHGGPTNTKGACPAIDRPLIDYCEMYSDNMGALASMGIDVAAALPQSIRTMVMGSGTEGGGIGSGGEGGLGSRMTSLSGGVMSMAGNISATVGGLAEKAAEVLGLGGMKSPPKGTTGTGMGTGTGTGTTATTGMTSGTGSTASGQPATGGK